MTDVPQIVVPKPSEAKVNPYRTPEIRQQQVSEEIYGPPVEPPRNFKHDVWWRERFWSIQNARDQAEGKKFGFWSVIGVLFYIAQFGTIFAGCYWLLAGYVAKWL